MMASVTVEKGKIMTNAEKFVHLFGLYATELWSKSEKDFLIWLNAEYENIHDANIGELIDRQAAIDAMCCACGYDCDKSKFVYNAPQDEQVIMCPEHYALSTLPPAQPETKKGKWIRTRTLTHDGELYCDQCEQEHPEQKIIWNFCPNCGCRMEEGDSDEKD